jgi:two-component system nitrate/nitrite response regulator NarL
MEEKIRLVIADDHTLFIEGLQLILKDHPEIEINDIAQNGKELMDIVRKKMPDVILLDINMPVMNGLDALKYLKKEFIQAKVILLSTYNEEHLIEKARILGAHGYLLKNVNKSELVETIHLVSQGKSCFPYRPPAQQLLMDGEDGFLKQFNVTKRENEILLLIKDGMTNQQISEALHLSIYTIETHRKNIMQKLKLKTPAELIKFIIGHNL